MDRAPLLPAVSVVHDVDLEPVCVASHQTDGPPCIPVWYGRGGVDEFGHPVVAVFFQSKLESAANSDTAASRRFSNVDDLRNSAAAIVTGQEPVPVGLFERDDPTGPVARNQEALASSFGRTSDIFVGIRNDTGDSCGGGTWTWTTCM